MKIIFSVLMAAMVAAAGPMTARAGDFSFMPLDIYIVCGDQPLAAYQFELRYDSWAYSIVGVEGGEGGLSEGPYYDTRALESGRIIIASFTTSPRPLSGRVRVATVHVAVDEDVSPDEEFSVALTVAAGPDEKPFEAAVEIVPRDGEDRLKH